MIIKSLQNNHIIIKLQQNTVKLLNNEYVRAMEIVLYLEVRHTDGCVYKSFR